MTDQAETYSDQILEFTLPARGARGRVVRLDDLLDQVLSAHSYPAPITHLLGEALVLTALMGSLLKGDDAQMTMQAQTQEGAVRLLVCDYRAGELRGYVDFEPFVFRHNKCELNSRQTKLHITYACMRSLFDRRENKFG